MPLLRSMTGMRMPLRRVKVVSSSRLANPPRDAMKSSRSANITRFIATMHHPCIVYASKCSAPTENVGIVATSAPTAGPKMKPRHAKVLSLLVSSVRCDGGAAIERYDCSTACWPPEPMPCSSRPTKTMYGAAGAETCSKAKLASEYIAAPEIASTQHSRSVGFVPAQLESAPSAIEPIASPILNAATTHA